MTTSEDCDPAPDPRVSRLLCCAPSEVDVRSACVCCCCCCCAICVSKRCAAYGTMGEGDGGGEGGGELVSASPPPLPPTAVQRSRCVAAAHRDHQHAGQCPSAAAAARPDVYECCTAPSCRPSRCAQDGQPWPRSLAPARGMLYSLSSSLLVWMMLPRRAQLHRRRRTTRRRPSVGGHARCHRQ